MSSRDQSTGSEWFTSDTPLVTITWRNNTSINNNLRVADDLVLKVMYLVIGSFGLVSNMAVIFIISKTRSMRRKLTNLFILNQSSIDFLASMMLVTTTATSGHYYELSGLRGHILCRFWLTGYPIWSSFMTSTYCLLALTLERYLGVVHTFWHMTHFTKCKAFTLMVCVWFVGPLYQLYLPLTSRMKDGRCFRYAFWVSDLAQRLFGLLTVTLEFIVPFSLMLYCYLRMLLIVLGSLKVTKTSFDARSMKEDKASRAKYNLVMTLVFVCVCFVLCWCWNEIFFLTYNLGFPIAPFSGAYHHFSVVAIYCNCCVNPIVYSLRYEEFQCAAKQLLCPWSGQHRSKDSLYYSTSGIHSISEVVKKKDKQRFGESEGSVETSTV